MSTAAGPKADKGYGKRKRPDVRRIVTRERWSEAEHAALTAAAAQAGLPAGAYIRSLVLGAPGPRTRRRPRTDQAELARLLGAIGKLGSNVNQITKAQHMDGTPPSGSDLAQISIEIQTMRAALMQALGREG